MIVLSNNASQTLAAGQSMTFNTTVLKCGSTECHRANTGSVKLTRNGIYKVEFSANIAGAAAALQLNIAFGGEPLPETTTISTPASADVFNNVSTATAVAKCCCDYDRITVVNTGTTEVIVGPNSSLVINKIS